MTNKIHHFAVFQAQRIKSVEVCNLGSSVVAGLVPATNPWSVSNTPPSEKADGKLTGKDIYLRNIDFRPEAKFLREIRRNVHFEKSKYSKLSKRYTEDEMWQKIEAYLSENDYLTNSLMRSQFGLSKYKAAQWLTHFLDAGKLVKKGSPHMSLYFLP